MEGPGEERIRQLTELVQGREAELARVAWRTLSVRGGRPSTEDVEDALAEAYLTAATRLRNEPYLAHDYLEPWFRRVLFFTCLKQADSKRKLGWAHTLRELEDEDAVLDSSQLWNRQILTTQLLQHLDDDERSILVAAGEGFTSNEIVESRGETPENVRKIKSRAIERLKRGLKGEAL